MNILVLSWRDPKHPQAGGAEQVMHEHMKGWIAAGHTVTLLSSRYFGSSRHEQIEAVEVIRSGYHYYLGVQVAAFYYFLKGGWKRYDLVVDQFHGMPFFTPLYVRGPRLAVVQETAREVWFMNPLSKPLNWIIGFIGYHLEPWVFKLYKKTNFMTGSESAKIDVAAMGIPAKQITVVPHGVIFKEPARLKKESKKTLIFLGVLSKDKGIEEALQTFALLKQSGDYQFWVVGKGEPQYQKKLKQLTRILNIEGETKFFGFVSQEKKFELLARAHLLVNPSVREGWGLVNIEANCVGTPVVAYRSPGLIDSVKEGVSGRFSATNTPTALAEVCQELLTNEQLLEALGRSAKKWSQQFSWEESRRASLALIERIGHG